MGSLRLRARAGLAVVGLFVLAACSQATTSPTVTPSTSSVATASASASANGLNLVVIGDSIPFAGFCPGCTAFVERYADRLGSATGLAVTATNRSRNDSAQLDDIRTQVAEEGQLRAELATADIVIVSVGFNNGPPWPPDRPCAGSESDTAEAQMATVLAYDEACIAPTVASYAADYDAIYGGIAVLVPRGALLLTLNVYNNWIGYPELEQSASAADLDRLGSLTARIFDAWNSMLCERAAAHGFACVDVYHAFNGADGRSAPGAKVGDDYTHPSQAGNDVIADLLAGIEVPATLR